MIIYIIKNKLNNKIYIGQTKNSLQERIASYRSSIVSYVKRNKKDKHIIVFAMAKYGFENFQFNIIEDGIESQSDLDQKEIFYIRSYKSQDKNIGYNIQAGGKSGGSGRYKKLNVEEELRLIKDYLTAPIDQENTIGNLYKSLCNKYNCSRSTILRILNANNVTLRNRVPTILSRNLLIERNRLRKKN